MKHVKNRLENLTRWGEGREENNPYIFNGFAVILPKNRNKINKIAN